MCLTVPMSDNFLLAPVVLILLSLFNWLFNIMVQLIVQSVAVVRMKVDILSHEEGGDTLTT